ncbi:hypothetical protein HHI36_007945 [Cryptolaemus montrouzieri]|uniref:Uncharacterized protein n=1 Tax=Cryptolaemus montrouzieri TaxID=559131 RepID=A0ABD2MRY0_9CUCU
MVSCYNFTFDSMLDPKNDQLAERGIEIHAISSASKPLSSWAMRDAIQECREACGGHGYLKASGLGDLRNNNDANCTYEGDNTVLLQQTSNWLLKFWPSILKRSKISTPLKSADFLTNAELILKNTLRATDVNQFCSSSNMIDTYQWLVSYLLRESYENLKNTLRNGSDPFWANSNNQVFLAKDLSIAYIQHFILQQMLVTINEASDENVRNVLQRLFSLYAVWSLKEHHLTTLYRGGFFNGYLPSKLIQDAILKLCTELKDDAVALIDAIAPPDFAIASVLGYSDGEIYKRLESIVMHSPYGMGRPTWWQELVENDGCISKSKL